MPQKLRFDDSPPMRSRYGFTDEQAIHFLTCTTVEWLPVFTRPQFFEVVLDSLSFCRREKGMRLYAYVIMDNHVHLVAEAADLPGVVQAFKGFTAREIVRVAEERKLEWLLNQFAYYRKKFRSRSKYQVRQEGSHPQLLCDDEVLRQKVEYIHVNPVRAGWVDSPEHWRYSSARNYLRLENCAIEIDPWPGFSE